eukprot:4564909-Amphidinium_carterae.2
MIVFVAGVLNDNNMTTQNRRLEDRDDFQNPDAQSRRRCAMGCGHSNVCSERREHQKRGSNGSVG